MSRRRAPRGRAPRHPSLRRLALVVGLALLALGFASFARDSWALHRLGTLGKPAQEASGNAARPDAWTRVPSLCAWLAIDGAGIDFPVCQADASDPEYYLDHDPWGAPSRVGVPFVDADTNANAPHVMVYGHHLALTGGMFTPLFDCYRQERFDQVLGEARCRWTTTEKGKQSFLPLCALSVDKADGEARFFAATSGIDLRRWAAGMLKRSTARSKDAEELCAQGERFLTLVTCSSVFAGRRERTLVIFALCKK